MLTLAVALTLLALPVAWVTALLLVAARVQRARETRVARQVAVTDAIHRDFGAVVAPVLRRRWRRWRLEISAPFEWPEIVGRVAATARRAMLEAGVGDRRLEIVLTAQAWPVQRASVAWLRRADRSLRAASAGEVRAPAAHEEEVLAWTGPSTSRLGW